MVKNVSEQNSNPFSDENINDFIGKTVTISKSDYNELEGVVVRIDKQIIDVNLSQNIMGTEVNWWITIKDNRGKEHTGFYVR